MSYTDKIVGDTIVEVITALIEDNTLIRVVFGEIGEERLCIINSQRTISSTPYFQIDMPADIPVSEKKDEWETELTFDFLGRDRLNYSFFATGGIFIGDKLWVKLPKQIVRIQQRDNFRIDTPKKSRAELTLDERRYTLILENISLGGAYCRARRSLKTGLVRLPVEEDARMEDLRLIIPADDKQTEIFVQKCRIARIVKDPDKRLLAYGVEFLEIGRQEKSRLTRVIYDLQRRFLKHRLRLEG